jgi:hypothetical protein
VDNKTVFINRKPINGAWGGGNLFVKAFYEYAPKMDLQLVDNPATADVCVIAGINPEDKMPGAFHLLGHKKLLFRVNECDSRKNTKGLDDVIRNISSYSEATVYVSQWLKQEVQCGSLNKHVIYNGCDRSIFKPTEDKYSKINHKLNIVCHHWSDNSMKGRQFYQFLKSYVEAIPTLTFTFIGRVNLELDNALPNTIPDGSRHIQPLHGLELGTELAKYDICINGSFFDPGPNAVIESISCAIPTYVNSFGGGGREFAGEDHLFTSNQDIADILRCEHALNSFVPPTWEQSIKQYVELVKKL